MLLQNSIDIQLRNAFVLGAIMKILKRDEMTETGLLLPQYDQELVTRHNIIQYNYDYYTELIRSFVAEKIFLRFLEQLNLPDLPIKIKGRHFAQKME